MSSLDIVTSQSPFRNHLGVPVAHLPYLGGTQNRGTLKLWYTNRLELPWKDQFQFPKIRQRKTRVIRDGHKTFITAVATVEPDVSVRTDEMHEQDALESKFEQLLVTSEETTSELDEQERLRRMRISKANKGKVPWNKGRKHDPETIRRIRERTWLAMQDPKIKMKLSAMAHAQSDETKLKIAIGVREGWQRRRQKLMVQEACCIKWQNAIAETSRVGYGGETELQWDSYKILDEQLEQDWLESIEQRKSVPKSPGLKRAPKSLEQRRKISEAINAKWADPEYRERVRTAIAKYHAGTAGVERKSRKKSSDDAQSPESNTVRRKLKETSKLMFEIKTVKKPLSKKKGPTFKDPMASSKLDMIKQIRVERMKMENRKREATERARVLIAEAEKAAKALEMAALKSSIARVSLLEIRKLLAEARRSIEKIENGELPPEDKHTSFNSESTGVMETFGHYDATIHSAPTRHQTFQDDVPHVNGNRQIPVGARSGSDFQFDEFALQDTLNGSLPLPRISGASDINLESDRDELIMHQPLQWNHAGDGQDMPSTTSHLLPELDKANRRSVSEESYRKPPNLHRQNNRMGDGKSDVEPTSTGSSLSPAKRKKWVCGRLVVVED